MRLWSACLLVLGLTSLAGAQPLIEHVPESALLYLGSRGTLDPGPGYAGSHTEAIANESQITTKWAKVFQDGLANARQQLPRDIPTIDAFGAIIPQLCQYPTAFFIDSVERNGGIEVRAALLVKAGADAKPLRERFDLLLGPEPRKEPIRVSEDAGIVTLTINFAPQELGDVKGPDRRLVGRETFVRTMAQVSKDPAVVLYMDIDNVRKLALSGVKRLGRAGDIESVLKGLDESGLSGVHSIGMTGAFENRNWDEKMFLDAPAPRKGLFAILEPKPFNDDLLKRVPANARTFTAMRFDVMKLLLEIKRITAALSPEAADLLNKGIGGATLAIGKNIENDVFDPLGSEYVMYRSPDVGSEPLKQIVLVSKVDNSLKAKQGLAAVWIFLTNTANAFTPPDFRVFKSEIVRDNELSIFSLTLAGMSPSWVVKDGYLYAGFDPKTVAAAARYAGPGIGENAAVSEMLKSLGSQNVLSTSYADVPQDLAAGHAAIAHSIERSGQLINDGISKATGIAGDAPVKFPTIDQLLPSLEILKKHASASAEVSWADDNGFHSHRVDAFPGASMISGVVETDAIVDGIIRSVQPAIDAYNQRQNRRNPTTFPAGGF